jgi:FkbM family methyltransferase
MELFNGIAILEDDSHISKWVKESGRLDHDQSFLGQVKDYIPEGGTVIDIGAYIGDHTIYYINKVGQNGRVYAFEPNVRSFECLKHNLGMYTNCYLYCNPVSDIIGKFNVVEPCENIGMTFIEAGDKVESIIIDDLDIGKVDFIKIDVEGFEIEVLNSCKKIIEKYSPTLVIEVNIYTLNRFGLTKDDLFNKIRELGYDYSNIYTWINCEGDQFDIICTRS